MTNFLHEFRVKDSIEDQDVVVAEGEAFHARMHLHTKCLCLSTDIVVQRGARPTIDV